MDCFTRGIIFSSLPVAVAAGSSCRQFFPEIKHNAA
jgi:hypothetical protein